MKDPVHSPNSNKIEFDNIIKFYNQSMLTTVPVSKGLTFDLPKYSSIAVLGPNGGGKTTAFRIALGEVLQNSGKVMINNKKLKFMSSPNISYVPQFEHFDENSTPIEIIVSYAMLAGYSYSEAFQVMEYVVEVVNLGKHKKKRFGDLSGGNKRKVAVAVALMKSEDIFMLDEPTTGVDIKSSIDIWKAVRDVINKGSSVIMASHSMVETEELANKIMILVKGKIVDIDTPESLKKKYGERFKIKAEFENEMLLDDEFKEKFEKMIGKFEYFGDGSKHLNFMVARKNLSLSNMIKKVLDVKEEFGIVKFLVEYEGLDEVLTSILRDLGNE